MMCVVAASATWLLIASGWGLPVSTTHTVVGGIIGFTIASQGYECVKWGFNGFGGIVVSWLLSPVFAGVLGGALHVLVMFCVVKRPDPMSAGLKSIPVMVTFTMVVVSALIFFKTPLTKGWAEWISWVVVVSVGLVSLALSFFFGVPFIYKLIALRTSWEEKTRADDEPAHVVEPPSDGEISLDQKTAHRRKPKDSEQVALDIDEHSPLKIDPRVLPNQNPINEDTLDRVEKEDLVGRDVFSFFQVFSAALQSFAHGANDTANAIGPWATIYYLFTRDPSSATATPIWALAAGAVGIVLGLLLFGGRVMETIGKGIVKINFVRGFSIEYSSMLAVIIASRLGFPISTTHCKVGSVIFVGLTNRWLYNTRLAPAEPLTDEHSVDVKVILEIALSWIITVPISALGTAGLFGFFVRLLILGYPWAPITNSTNSTNITEVWL